MNEPIDQEILFKNWEARGDGRKGNRFKERDSKTGRYVSVGKKTYDKKLHYSKNKEFILWNGKRYRALNRERINARRRELRALNPTKYSEQKKAWSRRNPDKLKASRKRYYLKHKDRILKQTAAYTKAHPFQRKNAQHRYNTSEKGKSAMRRWAKTIGKLPKHYAKRKTSETKRRNLEKTMCLPDANMAIQTLITKKSWTCYYCGIKILNRSDMHIDHMRPISKGGLHAAFNLVPACAKCNLNKGTQDPRKFLQSQGEFIW